jgi:2-alkyl-3-oxoalkanoate reductase
MGCNPPEIWRGSPLIGDQPALLSVALTGATGFVGTHVLDLLLSRGHQVKALSRSTTPIDHPQLTWVSGSLQDRTALSELTAGVDVVIHIAGAIKAANRQQFFDDNVGGTENLLAAIENNPHKAPVKYIHLSSLAAREPALSPYGASKAEAEALVLSSANSLSSTILRPAAVYGPGDQETLFYFTAATAPVAAVPGSAKHRTSLIHVHDLASALVHLAEHEQPGETLLDIDDGKEDGYAVLDVLNMIAPNKRKWFNTLYLPLPLLLTIAWVGSLLARITGQLPILGTGKARELCHNDWVCHGTALDSASDWSPDIVAASGMPQTRQWYEEHHFLR